MGTRYIIHGPLSLSCMQHLRSHSLQTVSLYGALYLSGRQWNIVFSVEPNLFLPILLLGSAQVGDYFYENEFFLFLFWPFLLYIIRRRRTNNST